MTLVVDTSAIMAILLEEPTSEHLAGLLADSDDAIMSAVTLVEATIVAEARLGPAGGSLVQRILREAEITVVDVTELTALDAIDGWRTYGKGRHRAALNLGDCFTYALAIRRNLPVLCTGGDFAETDVAVQPGPD